MFCIGENSMVFKYVNADFQNDQEIAIHAISNNAEAIRYIG